MELHDNVNQLLVTCKHLLEQETYMENASLFGKKSAQYLQNAIYEIRKVSHKLHQEGREDLSIEKAIKEVVYTINLSHKLNLNLEMEGKEYIDLYSGTQSLYRTG